MALKWLRDNLKSLTWILWAVIAVFVGLVFFEWGGVTRMRTEEAAIAATIGDQQVTYGEFQDEYQALERRYREAFGGQFNNDLAKQLNLPMQALNQVVNRKLLLREAEVAGIAVTDKELRDAILELPYFQREDGSFIGRDEYRRRIRSGLRQTVEEFEESYRDQLAIQRLNEVLRATAWVSDEEVEKAYRERSEKAKIRFVQLPSSEVQGPIEVGQAELAAWYEKHKEDYRLPEQRVVDLLLADSAKLRQTLEVTDAELQAYYDEHPSDFTREDQVRARHILIKVTPERPAPAAKALADDLLRRLQAGEDFATLAREHSEDEGSATRGGSLGSFGRGQMVKPFEDAAFGAAVGALAGPVESEFGFHVIQVEDKTAGGLQPFEQAKPVVRARIAGEKVEEIGAAKAKDVATRLAADDAKRDREALQALAAEEALTFETVGPFGREEPVPGIGRVPELGTAVFGLSEGAASKPVKVPRGWAVAVLREVKAPRTREIAEVETEVRRAVEGEMRREAARARLAAARVGGQDDLDAIAAMLGLEVQESAEFGRLDPIGTLGRAPEVAAAALGLEVGALGGPFLSGNGAVLFEVVERKRFDAAEFAAAKDETREQQELERVNGLLSAILEARRRDFAPKYDPRLLETFQIQPEAQGQPQA